ncbi:hypothetical protein HDU98_011488 [Podochytrium sp. JEL0797]|nr:hypothetical protein HDU98_011488 [Podochytrium sp. JEL0797]
MEELDLAMLELHDSAADLKTSLVNASLEHHGSHTTANGAASVNMSGYNLRRVLANSYSRRTSSLSTLSHLDTSIYEMSKYSVGVTIFQLVLY